MFVELFRYPSPKKVLRTLRNFLLKFHLRKCYLIKIQNITFFNNSRNGTKYNSKPTEELHGYSVYERYDILVYEPTAHAQYIFHILSNFEVYFPSEHTRSNSCRDLGLIWNIENYSVDEMYFKRRVKTE